MNADPHDLVTPPPFAKLGARLKEARTNAGLSMDALAERAGVPQGTISTLEAGKNLNPKLDSLSRLAGALDLTMPQLFGHEQAAGAGELRMVPFENCYQSLRNPRDIMDMSELNPLIQSIESEGIHIPLLGRPNPSNPDRVEIVAGERRFLAVHSLVSAHKLPNDHPIPVRVREMDDGQALLAAVTENVNRKDMHPLDEGRAFKTLRDKHGVSTADQEKKLGVLMRTIQSRIALAEHLTQETQDAFHYGHIKLAHAETLTRADADDQPALVQRIRIGQLRTEAQLAAAIEALAQTDIEDSTPHPEPLIPSPSKDEGQQPPHPDAGGPGSTKGTAAGEPFGEPPAATGQQPKTGGPSPRPAPAAPSEPPAAAIEPLSKETMAISKNFKKDHEITGITWHGPGLPVGLDVYDNETGKTAYFIRKDAAAARGYK